MDDFIIAMENTRKKMECSDKSNKLRKLILKLISCDPPPIKIIEEYNEEGDIKFEVAMKDLGLSFEIYEEYKKEILFDFTASFIGELLVRENIKEFAKILTGLDARNYSKIVNGFEHNKFGVKVFKNKLIFSFHISLLQFILFEDFKKKPVRYAE